MKDSFLALNIQLFNTRMKEYKKQKHMQTWNSLKRRLRICALNLLLRHGPRNRVKMGRTCPIITPAMDNCDCDSHEWCLFPQNLFHFVFLGWRIYKVQSL